MAKYTTQSHQDYTRYLDMQKEQFLAKYEVHANSDGNIQQYDTIKAIGSGAYGDVYLVRNKGTFTYHAMKVVSKEMVVERQHVHHLLQEKKILESISFPFIISLDSAFKDNLYLYFVLPYLPGGEMFTYLQKYGTFSDALTKFYASQVVLALEYLHHCDVIHRDIKPENIVIDTTGYIKLCDFGFSKKIKKKTWTLCGTPEYLAPEMIMSKGYGFGVDWWATGVLIYEMEAGNPPFMASDPTKLYERVIEGIYKCPDSMHVDCRSLIKGLLQVDPTKRIGNQKGRVFDIKSHAWFSDISWSDILNQKKKPPFVPPCSSNADTSNFPDITDQPTIRMGKTCVYEAEFAEF